MSEDAYKLSGNRQSIIRNGLLLKPHRLLFRIREMQIRIRKLEAANEYAISQLIKRKP